MSIVYLDLETADADLLWDYGPGFVRLAGYAVDSSPVVTTTDMAAVVRLIEQADLVVGHNILGFDLMALERYHALDVARLVREDRVVDTLLVARQNDPPLSGKVDARRYNLGAVCARVLGEGKAWGDGGPVLKALARKHGGYDSIPIDDPDYVRYLVHDVELVRALARHLVVDDYARREHRVMWRLMHIAKVGFRVDVDAASRSVAEQTARVEAGKRAMHVRYGLPLTGAKPHTTTLGRAALEKAFVAAGVDPPRTSKGGLASGRDALRAVRESHPDNEELAALCDLVSALNGERPTAQLILDHVGSDGRVHPGVDASQASGRVSITRPCISGMGKRGREIVLERALLLPDPGHVLLCADLSQIDARAIAMHSQDPTYIEAFEPGRDLHSEMAAALYGDMGWDRTCGQHPRRSDAKAVTHATTYGMGAKGLAVSAGISVTDAERQLAALDLHFPRLAAFKSAIREEGRRQVLTTGFGRRMRVTPGREYTQSPAAMGQGTARDLMMEGILRLPDWLLPCLRAIVHDEVVLSVPEDRAEEAELAVLAALQYAYRITPGATPVPVLAEASDHGRDWADCYRSEKATWPEVARAHREQPTCDDTDCTWHARSATITKERETAA